MATHHELGKDQLEWHSLGDSGWKRTDKVRLAIGDTAPNPASTNSPLLFGPATVSYELAPSGSLTAIYDRDEKAWQEYLNDPANY